MDEVRIKQVILIRKDLGMRRGKEIAQGSHAAMGFLADPLRAQTTAGQVPCTLHLTADEQAWLLHGAAKICLRVLAEDELHALHQAALQAGLKSCLIRDSGRTEFNGQPTYTACAIGPAPAAAIDAITGHLVPY